MRCLNKLVLERQLQSLQRARRRGNSETRNAVNDGFNKSEDMTKKEVMLRLRLANDTMLLIKEKKNINKLFFSKKTIELEQQTPKRRHRNKLSKSFDLTTVNKAVFGRLNRDVSPVPLPLQSPIMGSRNLAFKRTMTTDQAKNINFTCKPFAFMSV